MPTAGSSSKAIAIPRRKRKQHFHRDEQPEPQAAESPASSSSVASSGSQSFYGSEMSSKSIGKSPLSATTTAPVPIPVSPEAMDKARARRTSFLSESLAKSEYTIVDIGSEDCPRLITCVKASQGFDWNQELFFPSYVDYDFEPLERRQQPVTDIILTDEEAAALLPQ